MWPLTRFFTEQQHRVMWWSLVLGLLVATVMIIWNIRVIRVQNQTVVGWAWQSGEVRFTNSVTRRPVKITFDLRQPFSHFVMTTDPDTEGYYTGGEYHINDRLKGQQLNQLDYCSVVGMSIRIGDNTWSIKRDCLMAQVLWPLKTP